MCVNQAGTFSCECSEGLVRSQAGVCEKPKKKKKKKKAKKGMSAALSMLYTHAHCVAMVTVHGLLGES